METDKTDKSEKSDKVVAKGKKKRIRQIDDEI
jgi:hypothetical protein